MSDVLKQPEAMRELAREAARAFCTQFGFSAEHLQALAGPPVLEAIPVKRDDRQLLAFRWLGGGRGGPYVQPEISPDDDSVTVYGGFSHQEFGPWPYHQPKK
jgi:hypothetical protein